MAEYVQQYDNGTVLEITITEDDEVVDISAATTKSFILLDPDGGASTVTADFKTDGTDGVLEYTTDNTETAVVGKHYVQALVITPAGTWRTHPAHMMTVVANLV